MSPFPLGRRPFPLSLFGLLLTLAPASVQACLPDFHERETPHRVEGEAGAVTWEHDTYQLTGIGAAQDLGGGFVLQGTFEGHACRGESSAIVQDCRTGEAVAVGGQYELMLPDLFAVEDELIARIEARAAEGRPLSIEEIIAEAEARGVESVVPMRTDSRFSLRGFEFRLGEACRMYYPQMAGTP